MMHRASAVGALKCEAPGEALLSDSPVSWSSTPMRHGQNAEITRSVGSIVDVVRKTPQHRPSYASSDGLSKSGKSGQESERLLHFFPEFPP